MDIDIDTQSKFAPLNHFKGAVLASMMKDGNLVRHPCGTYFQRIGTDPTTEYAAIPHKEAQEFGFFKIDFLHLSVLDAFTSKAEIRALMKKEPDWFILTSEFQVEKLFHIKKHFDLINMIRPRSVQVLADAIALIRPGRRQLVQQYIDEPDRVRNRYLYVKNPEDEYAFKRSHAIAYAYNIVLQMHLIEQGKL